MLTATRVIAWLIVGFLSHVGSKLYIQRKDYKVCDVVESLLFCWIGPFVIVAFLLVKADNNDTILIRAEKEEDK